MLSIWDELETAECLCDDSLKIFFMEECAKITSRFLNLSTNKNCHNFTDVDKQLTETMHKIVVEFESLGLPPISDETVDNFLKKLEISSLKLLKRNKILYFF